MKHVWYHANCYDGLGAAWAAWTKLGTEDTTYVPMGYSDMMPMPMPGDHLYMVDYCRPVEDLELLVAAGVGVTIIDHHKTSIEALDTCELALGNGGPIELYTDLNQSGAVLAYKYFHEAKRVPLILELVQDRDLWKFEKIGTKEVHAVLCATPMTLRDFNRVSTIPIHILIEQGRIILEYHEVLIDNFCQQAWLVAIAGHRVPIANVSMLFSEVPHRLLQIFPDAPFAAYVYQKQNGRYQYGLRGRGDFDVSAVAKELGGGGHHNSAGFETFHAPCQLKELYEK